MADAPVGPATEKQAMTVTTKAAAVRRMPTPGWPEIVVGLLVIAAIGYGGGSQLHRLSLAPTIFGLVFAGLSGVGGLMGFLAALLLRVRDAAAFGVRRTTLRWLLIAGGVGIAALVAKVAVGVVVAGLAHDVSHVQNVYATAGRGGTASLVLTTVLLGILTPVGEEFLFRGVVTTALLRYGAPIGVGGSAVIFAAMHGLNAILPVALFEGILAAEVFRRSGSIWPAVVVHVLYNLPSVPLVVLGA